MKIRISQIIPALAGWALTLDPASLHAQIAWDGGPSGTGTGYATAENWAGDTIPGNGNPNGALIGNGTIQSVIYDTSASYTSTGTGKANSLLVGTGNDGVGSLTLNGSAGTLTFGGDAYPNAAWIGSGSGTAATGMVTVSAGTLSITGGSDASINLGVRIGGSGVKSGSIVIDGGTLEVGRRLLMGANDITAAGSLTISSGTLDMRRTGSNGEGDLGQIRFGSGINTVNFNGGNAILTGIHATAASNARSSIYFNGTTLTANAANADFILGATTNVNLKVKDGGLVFDTNSFDVTINDVLTEESGHAGLLRKEGAGTLAITAGQSRSGTTTVHGGTLRVSGNGSLGSGPATVSNTGSILDLDRNDTWGNHASSTQALTIQSGGLVTNGSQVNRGFNTLQSLTLNGGELRVTGTARALADGDLYKFEAYGLRDTVTVGGSAASSITRPGAIANAGINIGGTTDLGGGVGADLTFDVADATGTSAADLTVSAVLKNTYATATFNPLSNGLVKTGAGTLDLSAVNRYTGQTTISQGRLTLTGSGSIEASTTIEVADGAFLDVGSVTGGWSLAASQTLQGTGTVAGEATLNGTLAPGSGTGRLSFAGNLTLAGVSNFEINANLLTADLADVVGQLTYGGSLSVTNTDGTLAEGMAFNLFDSGSRGGISEFSSISLPDPGPGLRWETSGLYSEGVITVIPEPGTLALFVVALFGAAVRRWPPSS